MSIVQAIIQVFILVLVLAGGILAVWLRDLLAAVIALAGASLLVSLEFYILQAPDVAIAEAGIGAALTTAIYVIALRRTNRKEKE